MYIPSKIKHRGFEVVDEKHRKYSGGVKLPKRGTSFSAGYDFKLMEDVIIQARTGIITFTDIKAYMNQDEVLKIYIRSSIAFKKNIILTNNVGVIDADYYGNPDNDGNIGMLLYNTGDCEVILAKGEKIAQGIFQNYLIIDNDNTMKKRNGGYGSTGK